MRDLLSSSWQQAIFSPHQCGLSQVGAVRPCSSRSMKNLPHSAGEPSITAISASTPGYPSGVVRQVIRLPSTTTEYGVPGGEKKKPERPAAFLNKASESISGLPPIPGEIQVSAAA